MKKRFPNVNREDIAKAVEFYKNRPAYNGWCFGMTVDEAVKHIESRAIKSDKILVRLLKTYLENADLLATSEDVDIVKNLLGNKRLRMRIRIVSDGSYLSNVIRCITDNYKIDISPSFDSDGIMSYENKIKWLDMPKKNRLRWIARRFDTIYLQTPIIENREELLKHIRLESMLDRMLQR